MSKFLKEQRKFKKRTWKEAFGERDREDDLIKKKNTKGTKENEKNKKSPKICSG